MTWTRWHIFILVMLAAQIIPFYRYSERVTGDESSHHFPLVFLVAAFIAWQFFSLLKSAPSRIVSSDATNATDQVAAQSHQIKFVIATVLAAALSLFCMLMFSSAFCIISIVLTWLVALYGYGGWPLVKRFTPVFVLLLLIIPVPFGLSSALSVQLQFLASYLSGTMLDLLGVLHRVSGVVIETPEQSFIAEEACSGIRSLFSATAAITVYGVLRGYPLWRLVVNFLQMIVWVVLLNAARITAVIWLAELGYPQWAHGAYHDALGLIAFLGMFALAFSFDSVLEFFHLRRQEQGEMEEFFSGGTAVGLPDDDDDTTERATEHTTGPTTSEQDATPSVENPVFVRYGLSSPTFAVVVGCYALVAIMTGVVGYNRYWKKANEFDRTWSGVAVAQPTPKQEQLPAIIGPWKFVKYEPIERGSDRLQASESYVWTYAHATLPLRVIFSIDRPWDEWHDLKLCYRAKGWATSAKYHQPLGDLLGDKLSAIEPATAEALQGYEFSTLTLEGGSRTGLVVFNSVDRFGRQMPPIAMEYEALNWQAFATLVRREVSMSFGYFPDAQAKKRGNTLPASTIQMYCESDEPIDDAERGEIAQLYLTLFGQLLESDYLAQPET